VTLRLQPDRLVAGGDAMARDDTGRVVFVRDALPGEVVEVELLSEQRDFARAVVVDVLEPSADRVVPSCRHRREGCGGCGWMHIDPAAQRAAKLDIVRESLRRIGRLDADRVDRIVRSGGAVGSVGTRTTVRVVGDGDRRPAYRRQASAETVAFSTCEIAHRNLHPALASLRIESGLEVELRTSVATGAVTARWADSAGAGVEGLPPGVHAGAGAWLVESVAGHALRVSASSFFQSSADAAALLVDAVRRAAPEIDRASHVLDAYGGVGLFAAAAAPGAPLVTLVETSRSACADARRNLADRTARIVNGEVARWRPDGDEPVDLAIADPARPGLGRPGVDALVTVAPAPIVLVSCDPVSLARDATLLAAAGYRPVSIEVLDVFPHTPHVETVSRFEHEGAPAG